MKILTKNSIKTPAETKMECRLSQINITTIKMHGMTILKGSRNKSIEVNNFEAMSMFCLNTIWLKTKTTAQKHCTLVGKFVITVVGVSNFKTTLLVSKKKKRKRKERKRKIVTLGLNN